jgi:hypothetical protein
MFGGNGLRAAEAQMLDMRLIERRAPDACGRCGGSEFEHLGMGRLSGSRSVGASWRVRCRGCGTTWFALTLLDPSVWAGKPLEWHADAAPGTSFPSATDE